MGRGLSLFLGSLFILHLRKGKQLSSKFLVSWAGGIERSLKFLNWDLLILRHPWNRQVDCELSDTKRKMLCMYKIFLCVCVEKVRNFSDSCELP